VALYESSWVLMTLKQKQLKLAVLIVKVCYGF